jgi:hypothetical protein
LEKAPGNPHPSAKGGHILSMTQDFIDPELSFTIQVSGDFLGIQTNTVQAGQNELVVWNWKTGERKMVTVCPTSLNWNLILSMTVSHWRRVAFVLLPL